MLFIKLCLLGVAASVPVAVMAYLR